MELMKKAINWRKGLVVLVCVFATLSVGAQKNKKEETVDTMPRLKAQFAAFLDTAIAHTVTFLTNQPVDSIDIPETYALADVLVQQYGFKLNLPDRITVETKYPFLKQYILKLYGKYYAGRVEPPLTTDEVNEMIEQPITSLYNDKYFLASSAYCNKLPVAKEYVTTFASRLMRYRETNAGLDPMITGFAYINLLEGDCKKFRKTQIDSLRPDVVYMLFKKNAGTLQIALEQPWFYSEEMGLLLNVVAAAQMYHIGECDLLSYTLLHNLLKTQNADGGWHPLIKQAPSTFGASTVYLWFLCEARAHLDAIDLVAEIKTSNPKTEDH